MLRLMVGGGCVSSLGLAHSSSQWRGFLFPAHPRDKGDKTFHQWKQESSEIKNNSVSQDSNKVLTCSHLVGSG